MKSKFSLSWIVAIIIGLTLSQMFVGCAPASPPPPSVIQSRKTNQEIVFDESNTCTVGNNTYVTINMVGTPSYNVRIILNIVKEFEDTHPSLEIIDWKIEYDQTFHGHNVGIYGLWIHHKPKQ